MAYPDSNSRNLMVAARKAHEGALGINATMISVAREAAKWALYYSGLLALYHRTCNRNCLTVIMLHRVLSEDDPRWQFALPHWTLSTATFEEIVRFAKRHYNLVSLNEVFSALRHARPLPKCSLLITFDDGYEDIFSQAMPVLQAHDAPAVVFVVSDAIDQQGRMWTEDLLWMHTRGLIPEPCLRELHAIVAPARDLPAGSLIWDIVKRGPQFAVDRVIPVLQAHGLVLALPTNHRDMLSSAEIVALSDSQIAIGVHGKTHAALSVVGGPEQEIQEPKAILEHLLSHDGAHEITALSFPHGDYTPGIAAMAYASGYTMLFELGDRLNHAARGFLTCPVISRVNIDGTAITRDGKFQPQRLATTLFLKARKCIPPPERIRGGTASGRPGSGRRPEGLAVRAGQFWPRVARQASQIPGIPLKTG